MKEIIINKSAYADIIPLFAGEEKCKSLHSFGPYIREYYLIHICLSGKGQLIDKSGAHIVGAGELFIIRPNEITTYTADKEDPWHYIWIAFTGNAAKAFQAGGSVFHCPAEISTRLLALIEKRESAPEIFASLLFSLIYKLRSEKEKPRQKPEQIKAYVDYNYMDDINVSTIARIFNIERSYLYRTFNSHYGIGVKEYIIKVRMEKAMEFLKGGHKVFEVAYMTGYKDEFNFSRAFKGYYGYSPSSIYRASSVIGKQVNKKPKNRHQ